MCVLIILLTRIPFNTQHEQLFGPQVSFNIAFVLLNTNMLMGSVFDLSSHSSDRLNYDRFYLSLFTEALTVDLEVATTHTTGMHQ